MPKQQFYEIILDKMELRVRVPRVLASQAAENELKDFGEIIELAALPEDKSKIISRLRGFVGRLSPMGDMAYGREYLQNLIAEIEK